MFLDSATRCLSLRCTGAMNLETISDYLAGLPGATEEQPFGPGVDVYKIENKIFAILSPESSPESISLKCDPDRAIELRETFLAVTPGYHLNKRHWNTVVLDGTIPDDVLTSLLRHSYDCVVAQLTKVVRERLTRGP